MTVIIYRIVRRGTDKCYVGSTNNGRQRKQTHQRQLETGCHHSTYLQRSWNRYGRKAFQFEVLERGKAIKAALARPDVREKLRASASRAAHNPDVQRRRREAMVAYHARRRKEGLRTLFDVARENLRKSSGTKRRCTR